MSKRQGDPSTDIRFGPLMPFVEERTDRNFGEIHLVGYKDDPFCEGWVYFHSFTHGVDLCRIRESELIALRANAPRVQPERGLSSTVNVAEVQ